MRLVTSTPKLPCLWPRQDCPFSEPQPCCWRTVFLLLSSVVAKTKATQVSLRILLDKQNVLDSWNGSLISSKKEWGVDTCVSHDPLKQYAMKEARHENLPAYESIYVNCLTKSTEVHRLMISKELSVILGFLSRVVKNASELHTADGYTTMWTH